MGEIAISRLSIMYSAYLILRAARRRARLYGPLSLAAAAAAAAADAGEGGFVSPSYYCGCHNSHYWRSCHVPLTSLLAHSRRRAITPVAVAGHAFVRKEKKKKCARLSLSLVKCDSHCVGHCCLEIYNAVKEKYNLINFKM